MSGKANIVSTNRVFITDGQWRKALAAVRDLGQHGVNVTVGEETWCATSFFSKYCSRRVVYPSPKKQPQAFIDALVTELRKRKYDVLFPMEDETLILCAQNREMIEEMARLPIPSVQTIMKARDKSLTLKIAASLGIPHPRTFFLETDGDIERQTKDFPLPAIVKPRESSGSRGLKRAETRENLLEIYGEVNSEYPRPLVQECIPDGGKAYGVSVLMNRDHEPRAVFVHERIREYPVLGGPSTLRKSVHFPDLADTAVRLLRALEWYGVAMVEFKTDPRDGIPKLMEVNPRFVGSLALAVHSGVHFPYLLYRMAMDGDVEPVTDYNANIICRWLLPGDILHFLSNPKRFSLEPSFFKFFAPNLRYDIISLSDPLPTFGRLLAFARYLFDLDKWRFIIRTRASKSPKSNSSRTVKSEERAASL